MTVHRIERDWKPEEDEMSIAEILDHVKWASEHHVGVTVDAGGFFVPFWRNCGHDGGTSIPDAVLHSGDGEAVNTFWVLVTNMDWEMVQHEYPRAVGVVKESSTISSGMTVVDYPSLVHAIKAFRRVVTVATGVDVTYATGYDETYDSEDEDGR